MMNVSCTQIRHNRQFVRVWLSFSVFCFYLLFLLRLNFRQLIYCNNFNKILFIFSFSDSIDRRCVSVHRLCVWRVCVNLFFFCFYLGRCKWAPYPNAIPLTAENHISHRAIIIFQCFRFFVLVETFIFKWTFFLSQFPESMNFNIPPFQYYYLWTAGITPFHTISIRFDSNKIYFISSPFFLFLIEWW